MPLALLALMSLFLLDSLFLYHSISPIGMWALGCEPPLEHQNLLMYEDQVTMFFKSPMEYLLTYFPANFSHHQGSSLHTHGGTSRPNFLYSLASFYANLVLGLFLKGKKFGKQDVNWKAKGIGREVSKWKGDVKVCEWSPLKAALNDT